MGITISKELQAALDSEGLSLTGRYAYYGGLQEDSYIFFELTNGNLAHNDDGWVSTHLKFTARAEKLGVKVLKFTTRHDVLKAIKKYEDQNKEQ